MAFTRHENGYRRVHGDEHSHNDIVGFFLGAVGLLYGITLGLVAVNTLQTHLASFEPATEGQKTLHSDAYQEFTRLVELRRTRLKSVTGGLPVSLWYVLLGGAFLNIAVTWFFHMRSQTMHFWMTVIFSGLPPIPGRDQRRPRSVRNGV